MGSAPIGVQCPHTSSLGEFPGYMMYRIYDVNIFKSGDFPKWNNLCIIKYKFRDDSLNHIGVDFGGGQFGHARPNN